MKKSTTWLTGLLALQLVVAGGLWWHSTNQNQVPPPLLANFDRGQIDRIVVDDNKMSLELRREGGKWKLPTADDLPAAGAQVQGLFDKLAAFKGGWPVATTSASHQRFEVDDDHFQRHLQLYAGDKLAADLYVGTSPGFRKVHVRRAGDDEVYAVTFNNYDLNTKADDWLDKTFLQPSGDVHYVSGPDYALQKQGDDWQFSNDGEGPTPDAKTVNADKAKDLVAALSGLRIQALADDAKTGNSAEDAVDPKNDDGNAVAPKQNAELEVKGSNGDWTYRFWQTKDKYFAIRADIDHVFTLSKYDFDRITGVNRAALIADEQKEQQASTETDENQQEKQNQEGDK